MPITNNIRGDHFRFGSVFIKKSNQTELKKTTETGSNRPVSVRSFWKKNLFFRFGSVFFSVWVRFGSVFLVLSL
jgi:hypothetical protein